MGLFAHPWICLQLLQVGWGGVPVSHQSKVSRFHHTSEDLDLMPVLSLCTGTGVSDHTKASLPASGLQTLETYSRGTAISAGGKLFKKKKTFKVSGIDPKSM